MQIVRIPYCSVLRTQGNTSLYQFFLVIGRIAKVYAYNPGILSARYLLTL